VVCVSVTDLVFSFNSIKNIIYCKLSGEVLSTKLIVVLVVNVVCLKEGSGFRLPQLTHSQLQTECFTYSFIYIKKSDKNMVPATDPCPST